jgi:hypothetical protein
MKPLNKVAPAFVEMAHRIVWCSAATVDTSGRPRSRILHPVWEWDGHNLVGWVATIPTKLKYIHLKNCPYISLNYWSPSQDTCVAECRVRWAHDTKTRERTWSLFLNAPDPVGYDPAILPEWESPASEKFAVLKLSPWRLRVFPGSVLSGEGQVLNWRMDD